MLIPFTPYASAVKSEPYKTVKKAEPYARVMKSEPHEPVLKYEPEVKCEPVVKYEPAAKLEHICSPPSRPFANRFPIAIAGRSSVAIQTLLATPPNILKKQVPAFMRNSIHACGFPVITLHIYWPGYEVLDFNESVSVAGRNDGDIAIDIAQVLQKFMKSALKFQVPPRGAAQYGITRNSIFVNLERVYLRAIHQVKSDDFTVELEAL